MAKSVPDNPKILFEHNDFVIVSKPPGCSFHDEKNTKGFYSLVKKVKDETHLFPVHRLDKVTSGILLIAKSKASARLFSKMFQERKIEKYYLAISDKKPKKKQGLVIGDMESSRRGTWKITKTKNNPAITQFFCKSIGSGKRLFLLRPHTGKTHQIRVAMKSLGAPILGDPLYYKAQCSLYERTYLHAYAISFTWGKKLFRFVDLPETGELFTLSASSELLKNQFNNPWDLAWPRLKTPSAS